MVYHSHIHYIRVKLHRYVIQKISTMFIFLHFLKISVVFRFDIAILTYLHRIANDHEGMIMHWRVAYERYLIAILNPSN